MLARGIVPLMRRGGRLLSSAGAISPDSILDQLAPLGGMPSFQFRADSATLSGANIATVPNSRGGDALVMTTGTLAAATADSALAGAHSTVFSGSQTMDSNLPASSWTFLHDGTGFELFNVFVPTAIAGVNAIVGTSDYLTVDPGALLFRSTTSTSGFVVRSTTANLVNFSQAGVLANGVATVQDAYWDATETPNAMLRTLNTASTSSTADPPTLTANKTLRLGGNTGATPYRANMRWAELLIFMRVLSGDERQIVREYIAARYGIAAPA